MKEGDVVFLVGFYSPKEKSGVTTKSLSVYRWLKTNTDLSVALVSYATLDQEKKSNDLIHGFADLTLLQQKNKMKKLKKEFDIIIYDASSRISDNVLQLLPIVDSLYVVGDDNANFAEKLHQLLHFNTIFNPKVKNFVKHLEGSKTFILRENREQKLGFAHVEENISDVGEIIYDDYISYKLDMMYIEKNKEILTKVKAIPKDSLGTGLYKLGIEFDKALLFQTYVYLRVALGQNYNDAIERLFNSLIHLSYGELLQKYQSELYIAQGHLTKKNKS